MEAAQVLNTEAQCELPLVIALAGNPNSGKTTVFNNLTGSRQHVGNWPGVTVEKKEGELVFQGEPIRVVDLPGTYSLGAYSEDEGVACDYILFEKPDVVINIVDATNLERNLYLTVQLMEMGANVVVALNMYDELEAKKTTIDIEQLEKLLGVPVVPTVAIRNKGLKELVARSVNCAQLRQRKSVGVNYGPKLEEVINLMETEIRANAAIAADFPSRWLALRILEQDETTMGRLARYPGSEQLIKRLQEIVDRLDLAEEDIESTLIDRRYDFIVNMAKQTVVRQQSAMEQKSLSDRIDAIVTHRYLGIPIFLLVMWTVFQLTFVIGDRLVDLVETFFDWSAGIAANWLINIGAPELLTSLVTDGIINGIGAVLAFMPHIMLLFFAISLLEDSGYMARAAYIMDHFMHVLGLHGKSFIPLLLGFGCTVPAIMATRTLENKRDRLITILITPLMSCSARLPIYALFVGAFFTANKGLVIFSLYLLGMVLAIVMGVLFSRFLFKGETSYFVMELPPYRLPTFKSTFIHMWERARMFIRKAGSIILMAVVLVWALANLPLGVQYASQESMLGQIGTFLAPLFRPAGFGTWEAGVALAFGVLAKEVVVSTLGVVYGVQEAGLTQVIAQHWTPLAAYSFMVMSLLYTPCAAAIATIRRETNSLGWTAFAVGYTMLLAWGAAVLVYQVGSLLGFS